MTDKQVPHGMVSVKEFSRERSQSVEMAIERIKSGVYKGTEVNGEWYVAQSELTNDFSSSNSSRVMQSSSTNNSEKYMLSKFIVNSYEVFIEILLWASLLLNIIAGWVIAGELEIMPIIGAVVGLLTWFIFAVTSLGAFLILSDIRNRVKVIEQK